MKWSFFFHAGDGIRYLTVTGVQTCALPISTPKRGRSVPEPKALLRAVQDAHGFEIGRASCRERLESPVGDGTVNKKSGRVVGCERPVDNTDTLEDPQTQCNDSAGGSGPI